MLSTAVLAALALAPAAQARKSNFGKLGFPSKKPSNNGIETTSFEGKSSSKCLAIATTFNAAAAQSAHIAVIESAWAYACDSAADKADWWKEIALAAHEGSKVDARGFAFAKAIASAATACDSSGNAYGCASAYAYAQAWADAVASGTATAWSEAIAKCECNDKEQIVAAQADNYAAETQKLTAKVEALASASVCVSGDDSQVDADSQTCVQDIYFAIWAKAIAKAAILGKCVDFDFGKKDINYGVYTAVALAEAEVEIDVVQKKGCVEGIDFSYPEGYFN